VSDESEHRRLTTQLAQLIAGQAPEARDPHPCPYLPGREARQVNLLLPARRPGLYHGLMDLNFRRLGPVAYRPQCDGCEACRALRVSAALFQPDRSQRRCLARNADLTVEARSPRPEAETHALYARYLEERHDGQMTGGWSEFVSFLHRSPLRTRELLYRAGGRLVAAAIVDLEPQAWSAVYCYYDPAEARRALGIFNVLWLLAAARREGVPWVYLGYYVAGSRRMAYKADFAPCEVLQPDGTWERRLRRAGAAVV